MGEAPDAIVLVQTVDDVALLPEPASERLAYLTQTTLSVDETTEIIAALSAVSRRSSGRPRTTSVTPRPTVRPRSSHSRAKSTSCS